MLNPTLRRKSGNLTQQVVDHISGLIDSGAFEPGQKLPPEGEIVREQGVSRTVVREAISKLQAAGIVVTRHGIGSFVVDSPKRSDFGIDAGSANTVRNVLAMLELRIGIETEAAGLAAVRHKERDLQAMRRELDAFQEHLSSGRETVDSDFQFHLGIARAAGNDYFWNILSHLGPASIPRSRFPISERPPNEREYLVRISNEHEDIYDAVARRDPEAARAAIRNHLGNSRERMRRLYQIGD